MPWFLVYYDWRARSWILADDAGRDLLPSKQSIRRRRHAPPTTRRVHCRAQWKLATWAASRIWVALGSKFHESGKNMMAHGPRMATV